MAAVVTNGNGSSTPTLPEEVSKPPEGVVLPPKDIRAIVEKTAGYVARNGIIFEERVREKEKSNPKFSFLNTGDAYAAFYQWRLIEIREGRGTDISAGRQGDAQTATEPEKPKGPAPPPDFHFSARVPIINAQDLEAVKLTALFVAKRGKSFMTALSQREARNYQFDFLRPQHSLYQFFTRLVDQYKILLQQDGIDEATSEKRRIAELESNVKNKRNVLDRAKQRAEWVKYQEQQKQAKEEQQEQERVAYAQIDWHDFVVVETVLFTEADDQAELPPPASLGDLQSASLEQKAMMSLNPLRIEEAMPTDQAEPTYYNAYPAEQAGPIQPTFEQQPAQPTPPTPMGYSMQQPTPPPMVPVAAAEGAEPWSRDPAAAAKATSGQQPAMRIRSDYVPRAQARRLGTGAATALCPNCHQQIPVAELDHHMRIELLDPRWKEQRAKADSRAATTNLSTVDVVNNLKRLASQRSDVFDSTNVPSGAGPDGSSLDPEEEARRKRMALPPGVPGYEAVPGGQNPQTMNIHDQIRNIHERYGGQPGNGSS